MLEKVRDEKKKIKKKKIKRKKEAEGWPNIILFGRAEE